MLKKIISNLSETYIKIKHPEIREIKKQKLTYLSAGALQNIKKSIHLLQKNQTKGIFIEAGCALGGSTIQIAKTKGKNRMLKVYDVFGMIPPPTEKDGKDVQERYKTITGGESKGIDGEKYYGYEENLKELVIKNLEKFNIDLKADNVHLIEGLFENTLKINEPVAFAHIDSDWYSSVKTCLEEIVPNLSSNGIILIDDYYAWSGCKKAVDEYFSEKIKHDFVFSTRNRKLIITKK